MPGIFIEKLFAYKLKKMYKPLQNSIVILSSSGFFNFEYFSSKIIFRKKSEAASLFSQNSRWVPACILKWVSNSTIFGGLNSPNMGKFTI